jgi:hypothetical protein
VSLRAQKGNGWSLEDSQNSWAFSRPGSELGGLTQLAAGSGPASLGKLELGSASFLLLGLSHVYSKASFRASWLPGAGSSPPEDSFIYSQVVPLGLRLALQLAVPGQARAPFQHHGRI